MIKKRSRPTTTVREQSPDVEEQPEQPQQREDREQENLVYVLLVSFRKIFELGNIVLAVWKTSLSYGS
jgi:hypothetical protein